MQGTGRRKKESNKEDTIYLECSLQALMLLLFFMPKGGAFSLSPREDSQVIPGVEKRRPGRCACVPRCPVPWILQAGEADESCQETFLPPSSQKEQTIMVAGGEGRSTHMEGDWRRQGVQVQPVMPARSQLPCSACAGKHTISLPSHSHLPWKKSMGQNVHCLRKGTGRKKQKQSAQHAPSQSAVRKIPNFF